LGVPIRTDVQPGGVAGHPDSHTFQGLPSGFRTVFVLRDVEGLSTEETAEALELEHSGGEVAAIAGRACSCANGAEPLLSEKGEWRWRPVKCSEFPQRVNQLPRWRARRPDEDRTRRASGVVPQLLRRLRYHPEDHPKSTVTRNSTNCRRSAYPSAIGHHDQMCGAQETGSADRLGGRSHGFCCVSVPLNSFYSIPVSAFSELSPSTSRGTPAREPFLLYWNLNK